MPYFKVSTIIEADTAAGALDALLGALNGKNVTDGWARRVHPEDDVSHLVIHNDSRFGFWAECDGMAFSIDLGQDGTPYLVSAPISSVTHEPVDGWGEPAYGQIEEEAELGCKLVEKALLPLWEAAGRPVLVEMERDNGEAQ